MSHDQTHTPKRETSIPLYLVEACHLKNISFQAIYTFHMLLATVFIYLGKPNSVEKTDGKTDVVVKLPLQNAKMIMQSMSLRNICYSA